MKEIIINSKEYAYNETVNRLHNFLEIIVKSSIISCVVTVFVIIVIFMIAENHNVNNLDSIFMIAFIITSVYHSIIIIICYIVDILIDKTYYEKMVELNQKWLI